MAFHSYASRRVSEMLTTTGCLFEDLVAGCPDLSRGQIFREIVKLSRTGKVLLMLQGNGIMISVLPEKLSCSEVAAQLTSGSVTS